MIPINLKLSFTDDVCCSSENVIYSLTCMQCNLHYVGYTSQKFKTRFSKHKSGTGKLLEEPERINNACEFAKHYLKHHQNLQKEDLLPSMKIQILALVNVTLDDESELKQAEALWQAKTGSLIYGLNTGFSYNALFSILYCIVLLLYNIVQ